MLIALDPIEDKLPQIIKNNSFHPEISHAILLLLSNLVAASIDVTAVITRTTTILGFEISRKFLMLENAR
jgi:hypothetical protein